MNTVRFGNRVEDYVASRPSYPIDHIRNALEEVGLVAGEHHVLDVGAGTGIFTRILLELGYRVTAVEPNAPMMDGLRKELAEYVDGRLTTVLASSSDMQAVASGSVDFVVCAQAFHWMDPGETRAEFDRVLRKGAPSFRVLMVWNCHQRSPAPLSRAFHRACVKYGLNYEKVSHHRLTGPENQAVLRDFLGPTMMLRVLDTNSQFLSFGQFFGRLRSSSYMPARDDPIWADIEVDIRPDFDLYSRDGIGELNYHTLMFFGC